MNYSYYYNKFNNFREVTTEYLSSNTEKFLRDFCLLCYNNFLLFENEKPLIKTALDSNELLKLILSYREKIDNIPTHKVNSYSNTNSFWEVADIFKIKPKRYGMRGDELVWGFFIFYFKLHSISIDVISVEDIINQTKTVLELYYKYNVCYDRKILSKYWDDVLEGLIRSRYELLISEMNLLK